jgi:hypothetical protein
MVKLVWKKYCTDECTYGYDLIIPFEYESKDKFVFDVLEVAKKMKESGEEWPTVTILGVEHIQYTELEEIEQNVFTLEEWFTREQGKTVFKEENKYKP